MDNKTTEHFQAQWTQVEDLNNIYGRGTEAELRNFLSETFLSEEDVKGKRILDCGCGSGRLAYSLKMCGADVLGIDMIETPRFPIRFTRLDITGQLDKINSKFDIVISKGVIHHTKNPKKTFMGIANLVNKGGKCWIWVYPKPSMTEYFINDILLRPWTSRLNPTQLRRVCRILSYLQRPFVKTRLRNAYVDRIYDTLCPRYRFYYTNKEIISWFKEAGFVDIKYAPQHPVSVSGTKE